MAQIRRIAADSWNTRRGYVEDNYSHYSGKKKKKKRLGHEREDQRRSRARIIKTRLRASTLREKHLEIVSLIQSCSHSWPPTIRKRRSRSPKFDFRNTETNTGDPHREMRCSLMFAYFAMTLSKLI